MEIEPAVEDIASNLRAVRARIAAAGGDVDRITIVGVTKKKPASVVTAAVEAGLRAVGENYAQEAIKKVLEVDSAADAGRRRPRWHFIGQLQRNKVKALAPYVDVWHTVDSVRLVDEIAKHQPSARLFVQVNATDDPGRGGCDWTDIDEIVRAAQAKDLVVEGLMGVAPNGEPEASRPFFRRLVNETHSRGFADISCGMSADFEIAVQEGATVLRLGSILFGARAIAPNG